MAAVGGAVEPLIIQGKLLIAEVLEKLTPAITFVGEVVIPFLVQGFQQVSTWVQNLIGKVGESGITFQGVMGSVKTFFQGAMSFIQSIWSSIGQPVWNYIKQAVELAAGLFQRHMPAIKEFVRQAFTDISNIWNNHLKPAFTAIGNFINNVLAPAFKLVFNHVITPVVEACFQGIKNLWNNSLKPILTGIIDFVKNVFSGNFSGAFQSLLSIVEGIWGGLVTVVKHPINVVIGFINSFIRGLNTLKIPDWVPVVGGSTLSLKEIPMLAEGGVLERGQVGFLEGNGAEAVVPLHQNKQWISAVARDMDTAMGGSSSMVLAVLQDILDAVQEVAGMGLYIDKRKLVGYLAKDMDKAQGQLLLAKGRA